MITVRATALLVIAALALGWLATGEPVVAAAAGCALLLVTYLLVQPSLPVTITLVLLLLFLTGSIVSPWDVGDDALRVGAVTLLLPAALGPRGESNATGVAGILVGYGVYVAAATAAHGQTGSFVIHATGGVMLVVVIRALESDGGAAVARVLPPTLGALMVVSLLHGAVHPASALLGGRLRGIMFTPNTLGFYAALAILLAIIVVEDRRTAATIAVLSVGVLWWSASRASALATIAGVLVLAASGHRRSRGVVLGSVLALAILSAFGFTVLTGLMFREAGSRDASIMEALRVWDSAPLFGIGFDAEIVEVASSPLRAIVHGGAVGLAGVVAMYLALAWAARRAGGPLVALAIMGIVHSFAEGWLLSAMSPMLLVYVAAWTAAHWSAVRSRERPPSPGRETAPVSVTAPLEGAWPR